ncbi:MAG: hypothetical protein J6W64_04640 [Bacilli bacterium]|nr:hypothetical protein [Bacilli bacterium]
MKKTKSKRLDNAYANYKKRYKAKMKSLKRRGYEMADTMLNKREYLMVRKAYQEEGVTQNINQTIVSDQAYEYSQKTARRFKATAEKYGLEWKNKSITELRKGEIDVSTINEILKEEYPDWTGYQRQQYISYEVFGSE